MQALMTINSTVGTQHVLVFGEGDRFKMVAHLGDVIDMGDLCVGSITDFNFTYANDSSKVNVVAISFDKEELGALVPMLCDLAARPGLLASCVSATPFGLSRLAKWSRGFLSPV